MIAGVLTGCAATPPDPFEAIEPSSVPAPRAVEVPDWPVPATFDADSATFTIDQIRILDAIREASAANAALVDAHARQIDALNDSIGYLKDAGSASHALSQRRREMLEEERRHFTFERIGYWVLMLGLLGATL